MSRNFSNFKQGELTPNKVKRNNNCSQQEKKLSITERVQSKARGVQTRGRINGIAIGFFQSLLIFLFVAFDITVGRHLFN